MNFKNENSFLALGTWSLTFAILLGRYLASTPSIDFMEGLLYGVSIAANIGYLIKSKSKDSKQE